uniref:uncharacterized protein n=1 Tax=Myxine glutinosa TaxID=7769 RepID=UPI00358E1115
MLCPYNPPGSSKVFYIPMDPETFKASFSILRNKCYGLTCGSEGKTCWQSLPTKPSDSSNVDEQIHRPGAPQTSTFDSFIPRKHHGRSLSTVSPLGTSGETVPISVMGADRVTYKDVMKRFAYGRSVVTDAATQDEERYVGTATVSLREKIKPQAPDTKPADLTSECKHPGEIFCRPDKMMCAEVKDDRDRRLLEALDRICNLLNVSPVRSNIEHRGTQGAMACEASQADFSVALFEKAKRSRCQYCGKGESNALPGQRESEVQKTNDSYPPSCMQRQHDLKICELGSEWKAKARNFGEMCQTNITCKDFGKISEHRFAKSTWAGRFTEKESKESLCSSSVTPNGLQVQSRAIQVDEGELGPCPRPHTQDAGFTCPSPETTNTSSFPICLDMKNITKPKTGKAASWFVPLNTKGNSSNSHTCKLNIASCTPFERSHSFPFDPIAMSNDEHGVVAHLRQKQMTLQEALWLNRPWFLSRSRERVRCLALLHAERRLKVAWDEERRRLFAPCHGCRAKMAESGILGPGRTTVPQKRKISRKEAIFRSRLLYEQLPEIVRKKKKHEQEEMSRLYRLKAMQFTKKVTNRVLGRSKAWE